MNSVYIIIESPFKIIGCYTKKDEATANCKNRQFVVGPYPLFKDDKPVNASDDEYELEDDDLSFNCYQFKASLSDIERSTKKPVVDYTKPPTTTMFKTNQRTENDGFAFNCNELHARLNQIENPKYDYQFTKK